MRNIYIYVLKAHYCVTNIKSNDLIYFTYLNKTSFTPIVINGGKECYFTQTKWSYFSPCIFSFLSNIDHFIEIMVILLYFEYTQSIIFATYPLALDCITITKCWTLNEKPIYKAYPTFVHCVNVILRSSNY